MKHEETDTFTWTWSKIVPIVSTSATRFKIVCSFLLHVLLENKDTAGGNK